MPKQKAPASYLLSRSHRAICPRADDGQTMEVAVPSAVAKSPAQSPELELRVREFRQQVAKLQEAKMAQFAVRLYRKPSQVRITQLPRESSFSLSPIFTPQSPYGSKQSFGKLSRWAIAAKVAIDSLNAACL